MFVTATCEFSRWDDPSRVSAGEYVMLNPNGGGIALFTTVRLVFSSPNFVLNKFYINHVFEKSEGRHHRLGDLFRLTKNDMNPGVNHRNFTLIGDPAVSLPYPVYEIETTKIGDSWLDNRGLLHGVDSFGMVTDTILGRSKVEVLGAITDEYGNEVSDYTGIVYVTLYDKVNIISTLGNDNQSIPVHIEVRNDILFQGKASVSEGGFKFTFVVPQSVGREFGRGKFSYYSSDGRFDGAGFLNNFIIGGVDTSVAIDNEGPELNVYVNDQSFRSGDLVSASPQIFTELYDFSGINVGNGIGHEITAILDGDVSNPILLSSAYEPNLDSYQDGIVAYQLPELEDGTHSVVIKAWDIHDNSNSKEIEFVVARNLDFEIKRVLNYPNPFTTSTKFFFEHNRPKSILDVEIQIFTVAGNLIHTIISTVNTRGIGVSGIEWDGLNAFGEKIGRGVYVYHIKVRSEEGSVAEQYEKLVVLN
ncbi:MAG: type IX secretion system sortase PorU [Flavobacteriales bacterium]|nr:type IX secretion system sortase PorU [Flavobacteriales bacterium]